MARGMNLVSDKKNARDIAKKELKKEKFERRAVSFLLFFVAISVSSLFLILLSDISIQGFALYAVEANGGTVSELTIYQKFPTDNWAGIYGLALRVPDFTEQLHSDFNYNEISRQDLFFDCIQSGIEGGNEIYAATSPSINFENLQPADISLIDSYTSCYDRLYCPTGTYTNFGNFIVGGRNITNVPMTYTYKWDGDNEVYDTGVLWDGEQLVFVSHIQAVQKSYDQEKIVNYQMLLPVPKGGGDHYYFFTDPYDDCPAGQGIGENILGTVFGFVRDSFGNPLSGVEVLIAGENVTSKEDGSYNVSFMVVPGEYNLFAKKMGYDDYFSNISVNFTNYTIEHNFSMNLFTPGLSELSLVEVSGKVYDSSGEPVVDALVIFGDKRVYTDLSGDYDLLANVVLGENSIVALKQGYNNAHETVNVTESSQSFLIDLILVEAIEEYNFETGPYTEEPKESAPAQKIIEEVRARGEDYWVSAKEINKEVRRGTFVEEEVAIFNLRKTPMTLSFQLSSELKDFVKIDKMAMSVNPDQSSSLKVTIYGTPEVGNYEGKLTISGDLDQEIPVKIRVVDKKFPVEVLLMELDLFRNNVQPGKSLRYKLNLQNLLRDQNYEVKLITKIKDLSSGEVFLEDEYEVEVDNSLTLLNEVEFPDNFSTGDYLFEVNAEYLNLYSTVTSAFIVSLPLYLYSFFGIPLWMIFSFVSFFSFVALNVFMYKRYQDRKKRYKIQVDFSTLPEPGERVVRLGKIAEGSHPVYYEIDKLTTHGIVAGATGMGKSISAQVVIEECLMKDICVMVFDPTAQWSGMLRKCDDKKMLQFYSKFGLKPKDARAFKGNVRMIKDPKQKLDINKYVAPGQIQIFSMNKLTPAEIDVFVANVIKQIFRSDPKESPVLKTLLVFDEVHRLLPKFGGSGAGFLQIERACREFRKWGLGVLLISQVLNDFAGQIKANINSEFQARTLEEGDLERIKTKYGEEYLKSLVRAEIGVIMFQNPDYNRGRPYFVNFRPILHSTRRLTDEELEKYNVYNDKVDEIEYQVEKLTEEKVDTFDLKMELKLIKDKIMSGSFSVVEIYLEGLTPRVHKEWEKLGKEPPKLEIELVSDEDIAEEEARAKKQE